MSRGGSGPDPSKEQDSSEDEVVRRAQGGDPAARSLLARRHYEAIHRFFLRRTGDTQQADDLTQETFLRVFAHLAMQRERGHFKAWLYRIARRTLAQAERERRARPRTTPLDETAEDIPAPAPSADDVRVRRALAELSPSLRRVLVARDLDEEPVPTIARRLGASVAAVRKRLSRARAMFRMRYATRQGREDDDDDKRDGDEGRAP